ncbi:MAG: class I SAM-dependent methyltransferase [Thermodesulfovibrionales bacterium]|nr:class I SAM-dependent methyltransferase [Thermodesulfovibrionales bacterium]
MRSPRAGLSVSDYWTQHHVFSPSIEDREESLRFIDWRNKIYLGTQELMPFPGHDGKVVMDYGCGPGIELAGLGLYSKTAKLYGVDVSPTALEKAKSRISLHGLDVEFILVNAGGGIPIPSASVDLIHCSGVLHHTEDPESILKEFRRILKLDGKVNVMIYNYESVFMHLYVAYIKMLLEGSSRYRGWSREDVFRVNTDGPTCPISKAYRVEEFVRLATRTGFNARFKGAAMENGAEMKNLHLRWDAIADRRLDSESRDFLYDLTFDNRGRPEYCGRTAGVHACYELLPT